MNIWLNYPLSLAYKWYKCKYTSIPKQSNTSCFLRRGFSSFLRSYCKSKSKVKTLVVIFIKTCKTNIGNLVSSPVIADDTHAYLDIDKQFFLHSNVMHTLSSDFYLSIVCNSRIGHHVLFYVVPKFSARCLIPHNFFTIACKILF